MGLGPFLNLINSHQNSPQDTGTQNSSEHGFYDGEADNLEDEKWQRGLMEDYSNDGQMDKVSHELDEETLDEEVPADDDESYAHDLRTRVAREKQQLIKAHLEQLSANAASADHSTQNKENKPNVPPKEEAVKAEQNEDDQMELDQSQPAEAGKRMNETADQLEHVQPKVEQRPEHTNGQSSDLEE